MAEVIVNGEARAADVPPSTLLVDWLREGLGLTGTHVGCTTSQCGACHILLDGEPVKACTMLVAQAEGHAVTTIEGLANGAALHPMQRAFREAHGLQCGFCTPGMVMAGIGIAIRHGGAVSAETVRHELEGNLCRCTGYQNIVAAIRAGASAMAAAGLIPAEPGHAAV
jgi:carbon-monoxide dehydrogenase small subunit